MPKIFLYKFNSYIPCLLGLRVSYVLFLNIKLKFWVNFRCTVKLVECVPMDPSPGFPH